VPLVILGIAAAIYLIVSSAHLGTDQKSHQPAVAVRRLPPYYTVHNGDTFAQISAQTGLSVELLQAYNPNVNPLALTPGERLNLWQHPPKPAGPKSQPLGPMFWIVKPGESFGSIAASTKIDITTLEQLNPNLKPSSLQPGDQVRLRH
jgi:LysM repeat protein